MTWLLPRRQRVPRARGGFLDQPIDDGGERVGAAPSLGNRAIVYRELVVGAGAAGEDLAGM